MRRPGARIVFYYFASLASLLLIVWAKYVSRETNLPPLEPFARIVINLIFLNLAVAYFLFIRRFEGSLSRAHWWTLILIGVALCAMPPVFSGDLMEYLIRGRILGIYHASPYRSLPADFPHDILFPFCTWRVNPDSYGPLFVFLETIPALVFPKSIIGMIWLEKMILGAFMALGVFFFERLTRKLPAASGRLTAFFALSPLWITATLVDGHNDAVMVSLTIASAFFLLEKRFTRSFIFLTLAFLVKYTVLLVLPFWIVIAAKEESRRVGGFPWKFLLREATLAAAVVAAFFAPLWGGVDTFLALIRASAWFYTNTIPYLFRQILTLARIPSDSHLIKVSFLAGFLVYYSSLLWRQAAEKEFDVPCFFKRLLAVYFSFYLTITIPFGSHYLLWALPWLVLSQPPMEALALTLYSFTGLFSYFKRMNYLILLASVLYSFMLFARRQFSERKAV